MKETELTQKQEGFTQDLFTGMTRHNAYCNWYDVSNQTPATIDSNASRLASNVKVKARLKELNQKTEDDTIATVIERKQVLTEIVRHKPLPETITARERVYATTELNKMEHIYATEGSGVVINIDKMVVDARGKLEIALKRLAERAGG